MNILVVGPHPDDQELGMGGTIAKLAAQGHDVLLLDMTDGEPTPHGDPETRAREATAAAKLLGVKRRMIGLPNRRIEASIDARHRVAGVMREHRSDVVFAPYMQDAHPDHVATTRIVEDARFDAKLTQTDLPGEPIYPRWFFYYYCTHLRWVADPSFLIDITGYEDVKRDAIVAYHTQFVLPEKNRVVVEWMDAAGRYFGSRIGSISAEPFFTREPVGLRNLDGLVGLGGGGADVIFAWIGLGLVGVLLALTIYDLLQRKHAILRNFPIIGHFRYWLEAVGPELRQYIVTDNDEERPFSRDQRRWVYASSKRENNYFGFGTDNELELSPNYLIIKHSGQPLHDPLPGDEAYDPEHRLPCAKVLGGHRGRRHAFRPASVINVSAMSYGSLSAPAVEAMNKGCRLAGCLHNTGEGGVATHHQHGGELIWQIGTGYFGCRRPDGGFDFDRFKEVVAANPIRAIEVKLSQGAKPGIGGLLPAIKVTHEMAAIRGVPAGLDCVSPSRHSAFGGEDGLLDFVEMLAEETGLPVGIKSAVGDERFWMRLADLMATTSRGVDFINIDGGEGGTGAGPLVFTDHVALPFKLGITRVYRIFAERDLHQKVVFGGAGKLGFPAATLFAFAVGCDTVNVAREAMIAVGCIQAQRCHNNHCPTGVATQNRWLMRGLDPTLKSARLANYIIALRKDVLRLSRACGVCHPALITGADLEILDGRYGSTTVEQLFGYRPEWARPEPAERLVVEEIMEARCRVPEGLPA